MKIFQVLAWKIFNPTLYPVMPEKVVVEGFMYCCGSSGRRRTEQRCWNLCVHEHSSWAEGRRGFANTVTQPKGPSYSSRVFPRGEGSPTALHWLLQQHGAVPGALCSASGGSGTVAGTWGMGRGTSTAQDGCAALPPLSPWGTTTRVTHWTTLEMPSPSSPCLWKSKVATRSSLKEIPWKDQRFCAVKESNWAQHWFPRGTAKLWREYWRNKTDELWLT